MAKLAAYTPNTELREIAEEKPFLEALKIQHGTSELVKDRKASIGDYALGARILGDTITVVLGPERPLAMERDPKNNFKVVRKTHHLDDDFKAIKAAYKARTPGDWLYGPEFLVYVVDIEQFCVLHLCKSALQASDNLYDVRDKSMAAKKLVKLSTRNVGKNGTPIPSAELTDQDAPAIPEGKFENAVALFFAFQQEEPVKAEEKPKRPR